MNEPRPGFLWCRYCKRNWHPDDFTLKEYQAGDRCPNPYINNGCDGHLELAVPVPRITEGRQFARHQDV